MEQNFRSLAVCFPVWNRRDLFEASYASLLRQLGGITAALWIFDNGSDADTRAFIHGLSSTEHRLFKVFLPQNMGIPFVVNIFSRILSQDCDFAGYRAPTHLMLADADAYFKKPLREMIDILEHHNLSILSGHDSIEHESIGELPYSQGDETIGVKLKTIERGLSLLMRRETLAACVPFPHGNDKDVDWELMQHHPSSVAARDGKVGAVNFVAHLGLYDSTWTPVGVPADETEVAEINAILEQEGLLTPERRARIEKYRQIALNPEYQGSFKTAAERRW